MKSKSQLVREFLNGLNKQIKRLQMAKDVFIAETSNQYIYGHIHGCNISIDNEWEK